MKRRWMRGRSACAWVAALSAIVIGCGATSNPNDAVPVEAVAAVAAARDLGSAWVTRAPMPTPRNAVGVAEHGGKIYVVGGWAQTGAGEGFSDVLEVYDVAKNTWTTRAPMPTPRNTLGAVFVGGKLYAIGGWNDAGAPTGAVEVYDPATDTWTAKTPMPTPRNAFGIAAYDGRIYVVGGWLGDGPGQGFAAAVDVYVPATDTWIAREPLPTARNSLAAAFLGGRLYAIGGSDADGFLGAVESYDLATNTWRGEPPLLIPRNQHAAVAVAGSIVVVGGQTGDVVFGAFLAAVEEYVPAVGHWQMRGPLDDGRVALGAVAVGGNVFAIGGWHAVDADNDPYGPSAAAATVEQYAYPNATVVASGDWCVLWTLEDPWYADTTQTTIVVPQAKPGPVVATCKGTIANPTGEEVVLRSEDLPGTPCIVVNDWLPVGFDWVETIAPNGETTLVCRYE